MTDDQTVHRIERSERRPIYVERVNAVIDYIEQHLADELSLGKLADVAHFSPYHFHRVFSVLVGETLNRFITRIRIERAATQLVQYPKKPVTEIAVGCGIVNPSSFARAFRDAFEMSATEWRDGGYRTYERSPGESHGDATRGLGVLSDDFGILESVMNPQTGDVAWSIRCGTLGSATVTVEQLPALEVAYVRHTGRYQGQGEIFADLFNRLMTWAQPRGLMTPEAWILTVSHDNPSITEDDKLRVSACLSVPEDTPPSGDVGRMRVEGGSYSVGRFELGEKDYTEAWYALAGGWLPDSGYEPDDRYPYERFAIGRSATSPGKEIVDICLPVRPLRRY
ncbi:MAG: GyrI-like domain-containing protein [Actinomycetota bacterium]|nr:GyrI-like domain-containing protein [Actinomycetota bacterium]